MGNELSVYKQMTTGTKECLDVVKKEIGLKTTCVPFALKLMSAMKDLNLKTQQEELNATNVLLSGLQTLMQGGIVAEDYDKIDFVKRGKTIVPSARVEAFYRASARKGYRIVDTIIAVPKQDTDTTYFKEEFYQGDIVYVLADERKNPDRAVTAQRLIDKYFSKFICRLDIHDIKNNKRVVNTVCEMPIDDMLEVAKVSEQGLYKSEWREEQTQYGIKKRKYISNELNSNTAFWVKWTGEMVNKTIIRRALKRIKEVLPELTDSIYAFEQDEYNEPVIVEEKPAIEIPVEVVNVDLNNLTKEQLSDCQEVFDLFMANPKLAEDKVLEIKQMFNEGKTVDEVINEEYASITILKKSQTKWAEIGAYFNESN